MRTTLLFLASAASGVMLVTLLFPTAPQQGEWKASISLAPPAGSDYAPTGYTLSDIYKRLTTNATATEGGHPVSTGALVTPTFHTLSEIYQAIPTVNAGTVLSGTTILGVHGTIASHNGRTMANSWGYGLVGSGSAITLGVPTGFYGTSTTVFASGSVLQQLDTDFIPGNVATGVTIFDVTGTAALVHGMGTGTPATTSQILSNYFAWDSKGHVIQGSASCGGSSTYGLPKTGQTTSYATGDDGDLQPGYPSTPPRFTRGVNSASGTILDNATGQTWMRCSLGQVGSNCDGGTPVVSDWSTAVGLCNSLILCGNGQTAFTGDCSASGGILHDDWRLPNIRELQSIVNYGATSGAMVDGTMFPATSTGSPYWSSTTAPADTSQAYYLSFADSTLLGFSKSSLSFFTRCMR